MLEVRMLQKKNVCQVGFCQGRMLDRNSRMLDRNRRMLDRSAVGR